MTSPSNEQRVLVVGATGYLGGKVARLARRRGHHVRALVRSRAHASSLEAAGIELRTGDLLDPGSLLAAARGCDAIITTAIGYSNRQRGDFARPTDTDGNRYLAEAAAAAGVRRIVFCSVLTCDRAPDVPHFWHKKIAEDHFEQSGVPFVALRPGAFIDQGPGDFWAAGLRKGKLSFLSDPKTPFSLAHTDDLSAYLVEAIHLPERERALRIDIGCHRPASIADLAEIFARLLGYRVSPSVPPWPLVSAGLGIAGLLDPWQRDLRAMMAYIRRGEYVADLAAQTRFFGPAPRLEDAARRYLRDVGLTTREAVSA